MNIETKFELGEILYFIGTDYEDKECETCNREYSLTKKVVQKGKAITYECNFYYCDTYIIDVKGTCKMSIKESDLFREEKHAKICLAAINSND